LLFFELAGCSGLGASSISRDRFDYTATLSDSWKDEMLPNLVKLRSGAAPVLLDVASVITRYQAQLAAKNCLLQAAGE